MGSCGSAVQTYNPYRVTVDNTVEMATCDETMGSYYHKRYANNNFLYVAMLYSTLTVPVPLQIGIYITCVYYHK